ncbi:GTPase Era [Alkalibaculum sp. M08DMB]|uniref:GTPase Era n=1 Tax=Alkalibaculum sporogenes TaxID=2655001 RepID=A0A6A7KCF7_9FIRM|nr:GTPase Era [Alkalibaculum sporogenes]MPW27035.1 GTPase Era [Alkalibaculum sporogenes]
MEEQMKKEFKSGFISIIGRPNVGKSTLLNNILGEKMAIISSKPQTTRNTIRCVHTTENYQMVFIDTPGMHKPKNKLGNFMVDAATQTLKEVDVVLFLVDESAKIGPGDQYIMNNLKDLKTTKILVINKMDKMQQIDMLEKIDQLKEYGFDDIVPISAKDGKNVDHLLELVEKYIPVGPKYFPDDMITEQPEKVIVSELVREKALQLLMEEVPHGIAVEVMSMKERKGGELYDIEVNIYCERKTHKGIIIGKEGKMLKKIGTLARKDIENLLACKVNLQIWVKVRPGWRDKEFDLRDLGYKK